MSSLVLDCSVAMVWCFEDESNARADAALEMTGVGGAFVPSIWPLEIQNVLLGALPIHIDTEHAQWPLGSLLTIARELKLSAYDAAYIELAMRQGAPLATLDKNLQTAARKVGISIFR